MTAATSNPYRNASVSFTGKHYTYDVRVEVLVADIEAPVQIGPFFVEFRKKAEAAGLTLTDTKGKSFAPSAEIQPNEFMSGTQLTKVATKNKRGKVIFGATINGPHSFGEIMQNVFPRHWRQDNSVFIHEHALGFEYGVHPFFIGNRTKFHPVHGDGQMLADGIKHDLELVWKTAQADMDTDEDFDKHLKQIEASGVFANIDGEDTLMVEVGVERATMNSGRRDGLGGLACAVYIPRQYGNLLLPLFEYGLLNQASFDMPVFANLILPGLRSENENLYRAALRDHMTWMNNHRNVPLESITYAQFRNQEYEDDDGNKWSLEALLNGKAPHVDAVHFFGRPGGPAAKINLSTSIDNQVKLSDWLDDHLPRFSFNIKRIGHKRRFSYRGRARKDNDDSASTNTGKYSQMYSSMYKADDTTAQSFEDTSTIATTRTARNPWTRGQNIHCVLDFTATSSFPTPAQAYPQSSRRTTPAHTPPSAPDATDQSLHSGHSALSQITLENQRLQTELNRKEEALKAMQTKHAADIKALRDQNNAMDQKLNALLDMFNSRSPPRKRQTPNPSPTSNVEDVTDDAEFPMTDIRENNLETPTVVGTPDTSVDSNPPTDLPGQDGSTNMIS